MADKTERFKENVSGKYYVDSNCIFCEACIGTAPENFDGVDEHSYVKKQPVDSVEEDLCHESLENCPVGAIGDDGL